MEDSRLSETTSYPTPSARWSAAAKAKKLAQGYRQTTVYVHEDVRKALDEVVASGQFETRRAAMEHAIEAMFRRTSKATPR